MSQIGFLSYRKPVLIIVLSLGQREIFKPKKIENKREKKGEYRDMKDSPAGRIGNRKQEMEQIDVKEIHQNAKII